MVGVEVSFKTISYRTKVRPLKPWVIYADVIKISKTHKGSFSPY